MDRARPAEADVDDLPVLDLREVVDLALARGADLLTAGEILVALRVRALKGFPARLYARLTARKPEIFAFEGLRVPGVPQARLRPAADRLVAVGLADHLVPRDGLLPLRARAQVPPPFLRIRHRGLILRLERWALLERRPDRSRFVLERLGRARWPTYERTGGGLHADRRAMVEWERLYAVIDDLSPEELVAALDAGTRWPPGGLDLRPSLVRRAVGGAREIERRGGAKRAREIYERLVRGGHVPAWALAVRIARCREVGGDPRGALAYLEATREPAPRAACIAIGRAGRRLARRCATAWTPDPPLWRPRQRTLALLPEAQHAEGASHVEDRVARLIEGAGRRVLRGEGPLWTTLFALLFCDAYFLPVEGALPVPFLSGPLDVGTAAFAERRREAVGEVLRALRAGEGPRRIADADRRFRGVRLAGAAWGRAGSDALRALADGLGGEVLAAVMEVLLAEGWGAAAGLPDLAILDGPAVRLPGAWPSRLEPGVVLVEVKGRGDAVRDEQAAWFGRLAAGGAAVELWKVRTDGGTSPPGGPPIPARKPSSRRG